MSSSPTDRLMPGPEGDISRSYEVERGTKTESYITAISNNPLPPHLPRGGPEKKKDRHRPPPLPPPPPPDDPKKPPRDPKLVGLTSAELEKYRHDKKWKAARLILFVLFWLIFVIVLLAVILFVILSPKCSEKIRPSWWQSAVIYNVWVPSYFDSNGDGAGDMNGLTEKLESLRRIGIQTVWPQPFLLSDGFSDAIRDYRAMDSKLGVNTDADKFLQEAKRKGMKVVISLPIATTSLEHEWFLKAEEPLNPGDSDYSDFYTWSTGDPAFFSKGKDSRFYLHKKDDPKAAVLNWKNDRVKEQIKEVMSSWIDRGVSGFHLTGIEYLARNQDYSSPNWKEIRNHISDLRSHVGAYANESARGDPNEVIIFASFEDSKEGDKRNIVSEAHLNSLINYELSRVEKNTKICHKNEGNVGLCVYEILADVLLFHSANEDIIPQWEFGNPYVSRIASRVGSRAHAELLLMVQLVLPGANAFYYGDELCMRNLPNNTRVPLQRGAMQWDDSVGGGFTTSNSSKIPISSEYKNINWLRQYFDDSQSCLKTFTKIARLKHRDETMIRGKTLMGKIIDGSAFTITRFIRDSNSTEGTIYVLGVNFHSNQVELPLDTNPSFANLGDSQVVMVSSNVKHLSPRDSIDLSSKTLVLQPSQGVLFKYNA